MEIIETFGHYVENLTDKKPQSARRLLKTGWEAQKMCIRDRIWDISFVMYFVI